MEILLYSFSKEPNSTAQPSESSGLSVQGQLREPSSIESPIIAFQNVEPIYNYAYIPKWNRYYFINNWTCELPLWSASMAVDVLASFKTDIGNSTQYVLRSASQFNGNVIDSMYPTIADAGAVTQTSWQAPPWNVAGDGAYVVGIRGGITRFYIFTPGGLESFFGFLFSDEYADEYLAGWAEKFPEIKVMLDPMQYISSITWYPFLPLGTAGAIKVGWGTVDTLGGAPVADNGIISGTPLSFAIQRHPQSATRGKYLNLPPYTRYKLFYPPWGMVQLDGVSLINSDAVNCDIVTDLKTGGATLNIKTDSGTLLSRMEAQLGVPCEFTQVVSKGYGSGNLMQDLLGIAGGASPLAHGAANRKTGSAAVGAAVDLAGGVMTAIGNAAEARIPSTNSVGSSGGANSLTGEAGLIAEFLTVADEDVEHHGRPLCKRVRISSLSGFTLCSNADISITGTYNEAQQIREFMDRGFVYA